MAYFPPVPKKGQLYYEWALQLVEWIKRHTLVSVSGGQLDQTAGGQTLTIVGGSAGTTTAAYFFGLKSITSNPETGQFFVTVNGGYVSRNVGGGYQIGETNVSITGGNANSPQWVTVTIPWGSPNGGSIGLEQSFPVSDATNFKQPLFAAYLDTTGSVTNIRRPTPWISHVGNISMPGLV